MKQALVPPLAGDPGFPKGLPKGIVEESGLIFPPEPSPSPASPLYVRDRDPRSGPTNPGAMLRLHPTLSQALTWCLIS